MFYYWDGYEIDGSDTDFDLVLPETRQRIDFVKCFLSLPLFSPDIYIDKSAYKPADKDLMARLFNWFKGSAGSETDMQKITIENALELVEQWPEVTLFVYCKLMEQLPDDIQEKIYSFSSSREPLESRYKLNENPCTPPGRPAMNYRGDMTIQLTIFSEYWRQTKLQGYIRNPTLFESESMLPYMTLNCGPSFYYEYAMYIMDYMEEYFPGLAINGGLDCAGGWTEGCTYSASLYSHTKVRIPVTYSVRNILKYLTQFDLLHSYKSYYKNGWVSELLDDFRLVNPVTFEKEEQSLLSFGEYAGLAEKEVRDEEDPVEMILSTAIYTKLPRKEAFRKNPEAVRKLEQALQEIEDPENDWNYWAYFAFTCVNGEICGEYRVVPEMKPYLLTLLELAETGEIDFMKEITYRRRHHG
ncbi:MAG: hypothetical protein LUG98_08245 [Tannerellaceae bacterium]|nr:hypothetical protein [Tannerellaceae bacterium]